MTLSCSSTDFENDSDFRPTAKRLTDSGYAAQFRCVYRLLITQLSFRRDSYSGQPSVIHITTSKGDSRLRIFSVARVFTENVRHNCPPYPVIRVKQPALT